MIKQEKDGDQYVFATEEEFLSDMSRNWWEGMAIGGAAAIVVGLFFWAIFIK